MFFGIERKWQGMKQAIAKASFHRANHWLAHGGEEFRSKYENNQMVYRCVSPGHRCLR